MTFQEALTKLNHLRAIRSALDGVLSAAQQVQELDPALLSQVYDANDKAALLAMLQKTQNAISYINGLKVA